jgi:tRNA 2-selenouridine synthase
VAVLENYQQADGSVTVPEVLRPYLGGDLHLRLRAVMQAALHQQQIGSGEALHREWIAAPLRRYYDPMYAFQRQSRTGRIVFEGERPAVVEYLQERRELR